MGPVPITDMDRSRLHLTVSRAGVPAIPNPRRTDGHEKTGGTGLRWYRLLDGDP